MGFLLAFYRLPLWPRISGSQPTHLPRLAWTCRAQLRIVCPPAFPIVVGLLAKELHCYRACYAICVALVGTTQSEMRHMQPASGKECCSEHAEKRLVVIQVTVFAIALPK